MSATGGSSMSPLYATMAASSIGALGTSYAQSQALKAAGSYQKGLADTNATMADLAGKQTLESGDIVAGRKNLETKARVGNELATQGASGVDVGSGSSALTRIGTNLVGRIDELTIRNNAQRRAFGYEIQGIQDRFQGRFAKMTADSEAKQTLLSGGLQAISGPLQMYSNSLRLNKWFGNATQKAPDSYIDLAGNV